MLVSNEISKNQYVGDGSATEFAYTFPILDSTHIEVYRQLSTETALEAKLVPVEEYTVEGAGVESGGKVIFKVAPSSGTKLSILRNVPITQLYQYQELDSFPAESHENALAKLTMICQGMDERLDRAIVVSPTDTVTPDELRNNIFEASEDAVNSATAAASSETAAASSASAAASSASAAATSETNAAASASAAATSETNAAASASAAATSETNAASSESNAANSAAAILELKITVNTLNPGEQATASYDPVTGILTLGIPKGDSGDAAIATPTSLGSVMPQTGDEDGLELGIDGKLRIRKANASQHGSVLASTTAADNSVPMADSSGALDATWLKVAMEAIAAKDNPVATLIPSFATSMQGYLLCNGAEISRTTYKSLFDIIGTQFGEGDGSTTFNLPDFRGKTLWGANSDLMRVIAAGLPNFSGKFWAYVVGWSNASGTGPFYDAGAAGSPGNSGGEGGKACTWGFDPSRVSSVYGKSATVQPPAIAVNIFIKY